MNRIDRLTSILIHLQSKKIVTAQEIAERFETSVRTVYRDIRSLEEAGIPIGSEAGKGYFIVDGYYLPPVMFTKEEATSLLIGEKLVEKLTDQTTDEHFKSALFKIKSVLSTDEKDYVEIINEDIHVFGGKTLQPEFPNNFLNDIQKALVNQKVVKVYYHSIWKDEETCREIEPIGLLYYSISWHLIAFCKMRKGYRDFRVDRIKDLQLTDISYTRDEKFTIQKYFDEILSESELDTVIVKFHDSIVHLVTKAKYYYGFVEEKRDDEFIEMTFLTNSLEYIARWLITFGNKIVIVKPKSLHTRLIDLTKELKDFYLSN
jgi:predicted DNA-binding transcriptional regulator YafY